jgi:uncharacterized membrane protein
MTKKNLTEYKRKYNAFRHHAWAGLGFLAVFSVMTALLPKHTQILTPFIFILIIYIVVALILTYRYRSGLAVEDTIIKAEPSVEIEKERLNAEVEKERLKLEKKKAKAEAKKAKK